MSININRTVIIYALIAGLIVLIAASIVQLGTKTLPPVSTSVTTPTKEAEEAPALNYAIPVNPLPTDNEIEESVKVQNERQEVVKQMIADKMKKIAAISKEIRMRQNEPALTTDENEQKTTAQPVNPASSAKKFKQIPKEILRNIRSQRYLVR